MPPRSSLGAQVGPGPTTRFLTFSEHAERCSLRLFRDAKTPLMTVPMHALGDGYHELYLEDVGHGALYKFVLDDTALPDPYARFMPYSVHGPSMAIEPRYSFRHARPARPVRPILYELHIGSFTEEGTYRAACLRLPLLRELGVTTVELMPVNAFQGQHGWGYDGVALFAPFTPYGTPDELRAFVDVAHGLGLTVLLDVVYNHFGPAGNYLAAYSQSYFHADKGTWGDAPNFEQPVMRALVLDNVRYWLEEFRFDGLRFDAVHAIVDRSPKHLMQEVVEQARHVYPQALLIAEDDRNEPALVKDWGLDAIWADDFHHQLHVTLTGERDGYYAGFAPGVEGLARAIERGFLYEGQASPSGEARGKPADPLPAEAFVYCIQNHDQVGNRALGDRLSAALSPDAYALASAVLLFLPMTPLLFMGQEWAAETPFQFFTDHDPELGAQVARGRREEFKGFRTFSDEAARALIPDPQAEATFRASKLRWEERELLGHREVLAQYRALIALRTHDPVLARSGREQLGARAIGELLVVTRQHEGAERIMLANFAGEPRKLPAEYLGLGEVSLGPDAGALSRGELPGFGFVILARGAASDGE
jgi:maltooligosyltrehalose trehalohydrolase